MMDDDAIVIPSDNDENDIDGVNFLLRSDSPLRKRPRYTDGPLDEDLHEGPSNRSESPPSDRIVRDNAYYFSDGSCVLLVENVLFNVHRTILSKDQSSFKTMFSLPPGDHEVEGASDENPIILRGDTVKEFRSFLWALYALPHELILLQSRESPTRSLLTTLIEIARVSNKYSFKSLETWALDVIQDHVNHKPSPILASIPVPATFTFNPNPSASQNAPHAESIAQLTSLVSLAVMCDHSRLLGTMIGLLRQLMGLSLQYAYLSMTLADNLNLRPLKGAAYMEVMQKAVVVRRSPVDNLGSPSDQEGDIDDEGRLTVSPAQQLRLLSGYYRLTGTWERLRANPPHFEHAASCGATWHQHGCTQSWLDFWKEKTRSDSVLALGLADVLARLRAIAKEFDRWGSATYMHHDCRMAARRIIQEKIKEIDDALPDYFSEGGE